MAEGQVIVNDNGGTSTMGRKKDQNPPIATERQEPGGKIAMDELTRGQAHHIVGAQIDYVTVSSGGMSSTTDSPSKVVVTGTEGAKTVKVRVRNRTGYVQIRVSENLKEPQTDVYSTTNAATITTIEIDEQTVTVGGGTTVTIGYDGA